MSPRKVFSPGGAGTFTIGRSGMWSSHPTSSSTTSRPTTSPQGPCGWTERALPLYQPLMGAATVSRSSRGRRGCSRSRARTGCVLTADRGLCASSDSTGCDVSQKDVMLWVAAINAAAYARLQGRLETVQTVARDQTQRCARLAQKLQAWYVAWMVAVCREWEHVPLPPPLTLPRARWQALGFPERGWCTGVAGGRRAIACEARERAAHLTCSWACVLRAAACTLNVQWCGCWCGLLARRVLSTSRSSTTWWPP